MAYQRVKRGDLGVSTGTLLLVSVALACLLFIVMFLFGESPLYITIQLDKVLVAQPSGGVRWSPVGTISWKEYDVRVSLDPSGFSQCFISGGTRSYPLPNTECGRVARLISEVEDITIRMEEDYKSRGKRRSRLASLVYGRLRSGS